MTTKTIQKNSDIIKEDNDDSSDDSENESIEKTVTHNSSDSESESDDVKKIPTKKVIRKKRTTVRKTRTIKSKNDNSKTECDICCGNYNHSTRKILTCPFCQFESCTGCVRKFLLTTSQEPHCMSCKTAWSRDFWMDSFPKTFINTELKNHRKDVLLDREKSLLPASMPIAERIREGTRLKETLQKLRDDVSNANIALWNCNTSTVPDIDELYKQKKALSMTVAEATFEYNFQQEKINILLNRVTHASKSETEKPRQFVRACPADNCRGMLSTQWKCGLCGIFVCHECHEIIGDKKDAPHTCKPENIETAKLLAKDTKPCPKCASMIFRVSGCRVMWCTMCHTAFDWENLKIIVDEHIHNPHLIEWQRTHGGNSTGQLDGCGMPNQYALQAKCRSLNVSTDVSSIVCQKLLSSLYHNHDIVMTRFVNNGVVISNEDLRVKFLLGEITEDKFKQTIFYREKVAAKKTEIHRVLELYDTVCRDLIRRMYKSSSTTDFMNVYNELTPLNEYVTTQLKIIEKRYNHKTPQLSDSFRWY